MQNAHMPNRIALGPIWEGVRESFLLELEHFDDPLATIPAIPPPPRTYRPPNWTADERRIMELFYRSRTVAQMQGMLPGRTRGMITGCAQRLGLSRSSRSPLYTPRRASV